MSAKVCRGIKWSGAKLLYVGGVTDISDGEEVDSSLILGVDIDKDFIAGLRNNDTFSYILNFVGLSWGLILDFYDTFGGNEIEIILEKTLFLKEFAFSTQQGWNRIGIFEPDFEPTIFSVVMPSSLDSLTPDNYFDLRFSASPLAYLAS